MARPDSIPEGVKTLSSNVWVRDVDGPTLAVLVPLLERALTDRSTTVQRQTVILIANLFKLVRSNKLAATHMLVLQPGVRRIIESASFPEIRELAKEADLAMTEAAHGASVPASAGDVTPATEDEKLALEILSSLVAKATGEKPDEFMQTSLLYVAFAIASLVRRRSFDEAIWVEVYLVPYLVRFMGEEQAQTVAREVRKRWMAIDKVRRKDRLCLGIFLFLLRRHDLLGAKR
jgi:elongation factor 3